MKINWQIAMNYTSINWISVAITVVAVLFIYLLKTYVNDKYKKQLRNIPIPSELIVVKYYYCFVNIFLKFLSQSLKLVILTNFGVLRDFLLKVDILILCKMWSTFLGNRIIIKIKFSLSIFYH
jgi:hypothetical protein